MTVSSRRSSGNTGNRSTLYGGLALALGLGVAAATGHGVSWADTTGGDSAGSSVSHSGSATGTGASPGPRSSPAIGTASGSTSSGSAAAVHGRNPGGPSSSMSSSGGAGATPTHTDTPGGTADTSPTGTGAFSVGTSSASTSTESGSAAPQQVSPTTAATSVRSTPAATTVGTTPSIPPDAARLLVQVAAGRGTSPNASTGSSANPALSPAPVVSNSEPAQPASSVHTASGAAVSTAAVNTAPSTPAAVSPIAATLALPARIVNAVLGLVGITTAGNTPSPINPAPLAQLLFAAFRRLEDVAGLDSPPAQPVPASQTFTGPLTTTTPTVAQFLNAATAEYVLGGVPAGLTPFTVNGWPVTSTNEFTGESAQVWVTPQKQIIIAYQGTTGGTNLLFNPLIAVSQILTDAQGVLTNTTPAAFVDALHFATQVQAEAAQQGYAPGSVFVTGHSLGGWEAEYVAQNTGLGGIGFESLGLSSTVAGNGADSLFVNTATYGDPAGFLSSDLPGLQPFAAPYVTGGGTKPHFGPIVLLGDPSAQTPLTNAAALWGTGIVGDLIFLVAGSGQFFAYHLPGVQAFSLGVNPDPGVVPWLGVDSGPIHTGFGDLTIPEFLQASSAAGILVEP
jgi:hypothetical protein